MPLITQAVAAYIAGLLLGFTAPVPTVCAVAGAVATAAAFRRGWRVMALCALCGAGALAARAASASDARCRASVPRATVFRAVLDDVAAPGAFAAARVFSAGCQLDARLAIERGRAAAGAEVTVVGTAVPSRRGVTVMHAGVVQSGERQSLPAARGRLGRKIDALYGARAGIVRALLIADTRGLAPEVRDRFADAGIVHILSISGMHVAIMALAIAALGRAMRLTPGVAAALAVVFTVLYVAMLGWPAPALRAAAMLAIGMLCKWLQRPVSPWAVLAIGGAAPLVVPRTVLDLGYQLSVLGMASLFAGSALGRRVVAKRWHGWRGNVISIAVTSVIATVASAPLVALTFGRVSLVAPLTNVLAAPIVMLLQPALFAAVVCPIWSVAQVLAAGGQPLILALDAVATYGSRVPDAAVHVAPTLATALLLLGASMSIIAACVAPHPERWLVLGLASVTAAACQPLVPTSRHDLELHLLDVGQGDALALRTPLGRWIVVDAGRAWLGGDAGRSTVVPYIQRYGGAVRLFVLTHPHADHAGGAATLIASLHPQEFWDGAFAGTSPPYRAALAAADQAGVRWSRVHPGDTLEVDGVRLRVLAPDSSWVVGLSDPNEASVVITAEYDGVRMLLTGDAERGEEAAMVAGNRQLLAADVLKVGHHGSATSSTPAFLDAVRPRLALISVGAGNSYGLPTASVLRELSRRGAAVLRTDQQGTVIVRVEQGRITIDDGEDAWVLSGDSSRR